MYSTWAVELVSAVDAIVSAVAEERPVYTTAVDRARPLAIRIAYFFCYVKGRKEKERGEEEDGIECRL